MAVIRGLVFDRRHVTLDRLEEALARDFEGMETLRQVLINRAPKYGNDNDDVDGLMADVTAYFVERVKEHARGCPGIHFPTGSGAIGGMYRQFGTLVGASPDGRHGQASISASMSPFPGRDLQGPTAAVCSYTTLDHTLLPTGAPLDLSLDPKSVHGEQGLERLEAFVRGFLDLGGSVLTITVTDVDTLLKAQREPEKHRGLRVRMGGWQAYFVALNREHQDHHIARVKHGLR